MASEQLSERLRRDVEAFVPPERLHVLPNGIPLAPCNCRSKRENGTVRVLFLSNMVETKGPLVLLAALSRLKEEFTFRIIFTGDWFPPLTREFFEERVRELGLVNRVDFVGPVTGDRKRELLEWADIMALPTFRDAFPIVLLEAMAAGLAIVSTTEGGIPDMISNNVSGLLVPPRDVEKLTDALGTLMRDPELRIRLGEEARSKVERRFTLQRFELGLSNILTQCLRKPAL